MRLTLDPSTRLLAGGAVVRRRPAGADAAPDPGGRPAGRAVARRRSRVSEAAGRAAAGRAADRAGPRAPAPGGRRRRGRRGDVAVVIPARDRADLLAACLARVGPAAEIVVVDDGSRDPGAIAAVAREGGARVRRAGDRGPGPAGARATPASRRPPRRSSPSWTPTPGRTTGWLTPLLGHFADAGTGRRRPAHRRARRPRRAGRLRGGALAAGSRRRARASSGPGAGSASSPRPRSSFAARRSSLSAALTRRCASARTSTSCGGWPRPAGRSATSRPPASSIPIARAPAPGCASGSPTAPRPGRWRVRHPGRCATSCCPRWALVAVACWRSPAVPRTALLAAAVAAGVVAAPAARRPRGARGELAGRRRRRSAATRPAAARRGVARLSAARRHRGAGRSAARAGRSPPGWPSRSPPTGRSAVRALDPLRFAALRAADDLAYAAGVWLGLRARRHRRAAHSRRSSAGAAR